MAYHGGPNPTPMTSFKGGSDTRNLGSPRRDNIRDAPYDTMQRSSGVVSGISRDVRGYDSPYGSLRRSQDPNVSYGSQRFPPGNPAELQDPNISVSSLRNVQNLNMSTGSHRNLPNVQASFDSTQGSLRREKDHVQQSPRREKPQPPPRNIREPVAEHQQKPSNYPQQQPLQQYHQQDYARDSRVDTSFVNTANNVRQTQSHYSLPYGSVAQHSPTGQGFQPTPTGPIRASARRTRDYDDQVDVSRQGSTRGAHGISGGRDSRPGSSRGQGSGAGNRRSTGSSIYGMLVEGRALNGADVAGLLQHGFVLLTGGRDTHGGPVITLPSLLNRSDPSPDDVITCLQYLIQIPSEETKKFGFSVVVDTRDGSWANLNMVMACLQKATGGYLKQVLVVLHENDKRANQDRPSNTDPRYVTVSQLHRYIDPKQLTFDLGGRMQYNHNIWLRTQLNYEKFMKDAHITVEHLDVQEGEIQQTYNEPDLQASPLEALRKHRHFQDVIMTVPTEVIQQGQEVLSSLQENGYSGYSDSQGMIPTLDNLEAQKQVKRVLQYLTSRVQKLQEYLEDRDRSLNTSMQYSEWKRGIKVVVDWVLGPGEKLLASQSDIGDTYDSADQLRRRHEEMEIKCTDTYGQYAELRHTVEEITSEDISVADDMRAERDYMDTVCRSFASRLERRRTLLITSVRFHRFAEELSSCLDELLELFCTDVDAETVEDVEEAMKTLQDKCDNCDRVAEQSLNDGQSLLDEMSRPIKNAVGKDITPDYNNHVAHVNQRLKELQERKMRCDELADVRKLKLQQLLQLRTCERDTDQAIDWIIELCDVMVASHTDMGQSTEEVEVLHADHTKFEATALGTYEYGKQLLQAALVLRRSLRYDIEPNYDRAQRLEEAWKRFSKGTSERANRLTVLALFLNESEKLVDNMENFISACARALAGEENVNETIKNLTLPKAQMGKDFDNTCQMGHALAERLALPIILYEGDEKRLSIDEEGASETISNCLRRLDRKMTETDAFWDELHKAQADVNFQPRTFERVPSERRKDKTVRKPKPRLSSGGEERRKRSDPFGIASKRRQEPSQNGARPVPVPRRHGPASAENMKKFPDNPSSQDSPMSPRPSAPQYPVASDRQNLNQSLDSSPRDLRGYQGDKPSQADETDGSRVRFYHGRQASGPDEGYIEGLSAQVSPQASHNRQISDSSKGSLSPNQNVYGSQQVSPLQSLTGAFGEGIQKQDAPLVGSAPSEMTDPLYSNQPLQLRPQRSLLDLDWLSPMYDPRAALKDKLKQVKIVLQ